MHVRYDVVPISPGRDITFTRQNATYDRCILFGGLGLGLRVVVLGVVRVWVRVRVSIRVRVGVALVRD